MWRHAWPQRDADAIVALYADDAVYRALAFRAPESARGYLERVLAEGTEIECWFGEPIVSGNRAAVEWWGSWLENGTPLTLAGTTVLSFDADGLGGRPPRLLERGRAARAALRGLAHLLMGLRRTAWRSYVRTFEMGSLRNRIV